MKVETKIVMKVGGKTLEMTPEEARQLRDELDMVVGHQRPHYVPYLPWVPIAPYNPSPWTTTTWTTGIADSGISSATHPVSVYTVQ